MESSRTIQDPCVGAVKLWKIAWMEEGEIPITHVDMLKLWKDSSKRKCRRGCNRISRYVTPHPTQSDRIKVRSLALTKCDRISLLAVASGIATQIGKGYFCYLCKCHFWAMLVKAKVQNSYLSCFHFSYFEDWRFKNSFESVVPPLWILG